MTENSKSSALHVTTGYDVGGARFVEFSPRKICPVPAVFILPSLPKLICVLRTSLNFTSKKIGARKANPNT
jgi:hypothetical protein